ncbi:Crp/Fnr family transcriptional regulator [Fluviicola chungangensis]|uniref:Crp/Fnr family transcriptional regulator n=1 Tax=Fluviicola chungangensis TaxID=2597671 RepID=A0A556MYE0_9FLAO|nr:Crp/Fnr family transcriptional regulator [Fluviicola chungangensis]TSJ44932.1 Crp/Fnr family transcriptional regulator [Fluviicola chungangensis]
MEAKDNLRQLIQMFSTFEENELDRIENCFKTRIFKKNTVLLASDEVCKTFYFINRGCLRTYFITKEGHEKTRYIMMEPSIGTALTSFISQRPSFEFIDALEESEVLAISRTDFYRLADEIPAWKNFYLKIMEMAYSFQNRKIESLVTLSAKERYEQLIRENPKVVQRVSNKILASYLDIKQETLSRLKSR